MKTQLKFATLCAGLITAIAMPAFAQSNANECAADADCPDGFVCEVFEWGACPSCVEGETCPPCEMGSDSVCVPPPPEQCSSDNACAGSDVCVSYTFESCSGEVWPACDPDDASCADMDMGTPPEPTCETSTESYCVPPYLAPCEAAADCGAGFTCEAAEICACSGGGSTGTPDDPDGGTPTEPDCSCEPSGENYCRLIEVECDTDADCAADLTCQEMYGGDVAIACVDGESCPEPEPVDPVSYCAPVGFGYYGGADSGGGYGGAVAEATGRDDATVTQSEREEFFPVDGATDDGSKDSPSSCSTAGNGAGGSMLLLLAGLLFGRARRR